MKSNINKKDMTPKLVGEIYLRKANESSKYRASYGIFECQYCGKEFETKYAYIKNGDTKSCGCQAVKHSLSSNKFYSTWHKMLHRCSNVNNKDYKSYGGRGITVCEEWLDVTNFIAWAEATHPDIEGVSLDRIDNDLGYSPENCRWAGRSTQNINKRISKRNTSGFVGVNWAKSKSIWVVNIKHHKVLKYVGGFKTIEEAVLARDQYIIKNKLPHKLSTQY